jgi:hypothetical protein
MIDANGQQIIVSGGGLTIGGMAFNSAGVAAPVTKQPGFSGWKGSPGSDSNQYSPSNGPWPLNQFAWTSGHIASGVFTCPIAGRYLCSAAGIMNGYGSAGTHGYAGFSKNNVNSAYMHFNISQTNSWGQGGTCQLFDCAAGDTLRFHVNNAPLQNVNAGAASGNYGWYPDSHHHIWITRVS